MNASSSSESDKKKEAGIEYLCEAFLTLVNNNDDDDNGSYHDIVSMRLCKNNNSAVAVIIICCSGKTKTISFGTSIQQQPKDNNFVGSGKATTTNQTNYIQSLVSSIKTKLENTDSKLLHSLSDNMKLLGYGLLFLLADVYGLYDLHEEMLHPHNVAMFGCTGKDSIMQFKRKALPCSYNKPNYYIDCIHQIDTKNQCIVANFECLITGKQGIGTDVMKFSKSSDLNGDYKVIKVEAIRHS